MSSQCFLQLSFRWPHTLQFSVLIFLIFLRLAVTVILV